jgi:GNAT superfamily N-acetyltransferase
LSLRDRDRKARPDASTARPCNSTARPCHPTGHPTGEPPPRVEISSEPDPADLALIARGLGDHAADAGVEPRQARPLCALARDDRGRLTGGLSATTVRGWLHVKELWVAEGARGLGLGTQLVQAVEDEARRRGCHHALVDTFDFQARHFYERLGYAVFGELTDFPRGHTRYFLSKSLELRAGV